MAEEKNVAQKKAKWRVWSKVAIGIAVLGVIALLVIFLVPVMGVTYYEKEPYTATEIYYEQEPYTTTETYYEREPYTTTEYYWETEPYTDLEDIDYRVTDTGVNNWFWSTGADCWVTIKNADTKSGYFYVTFNLVTTGGATTTRSTMEYIAIGEEEQVLVKHSGDYISTFKYTITPPTKEVTRYHQVQKTREVVAYRDVEKTREVVAYRDVEKTREVVKFRDVAKSKTVTVFEYLTE